MCVGEKRTLVIGPDLGYGASGAGGAIPGGATLKFTTELLSIRGELATVHTFLWISPRVRPPSSALSPSPPGSVPPSPTTPPSVAVLIYGAPPAASSDGPGGPPPNIFADLDTDKDNAISKDELSAWFATQGNREMGEKEINV